MSYTDDPPVTARNHKLLLALGLVLILQVGGCSYIGGDEFFLMPVFCTAPALTGWAKIPQFAYVIALALNPLFILAGLAFKTLTPAALAFGIITFVGIILQIFLLSNGVLHCDGP